MIVWSQKNLELTVLSKHLFELTQSWVLTQFDHLGGPIDLQCNDIFLLFTKFLLRNGKGFKTVYNQFLLLSCNLLSNCRVKFKASLMLQQSFPLWFVVPPLPLHLCHCTLKFSQLEEFPHTPTILECWFVL